MFFEKRGWSVTANCDQFSNWKTTACVLCSRQWYGKEMCQRTDSDGSKLTVSTQVAAKRNLLLVAADKPLIAVKFAGMPNITCVSMGIFPQPCIPGEHQFSHSLFLFFSALLPSGSPSFNDASSHAVLVLILHLSCVWCRCHSGGEDYVHSCASCWKVHSCVLFSCVLLSWSLSLVLSPWVCRTWAWSRSRARASRHSASWTPRAFRKLCRILWAHFHSSSRFSTCSVELASTLPSH